MHRCRRLARHVLDLSCGALIVVITQLMQRKDSWVTLTGLLEYRSAVSCATYLVGFVVRAAELRSNSTAQEHLPRWLAALIHLTIVTACGEGEVPNMSATRRSFVQWLMDQGEADCNSRETIAAGSLSPRCGEWLLDVCSRCSCLCCRQHQLLNGILTGLEDVNFATDGSVWSVQDEPERQRIAASLRSISGDNAHQVPMEVVSS